MAAKNLQNSTLSIMLINTTQHCYYHQTETEQIFHPLSYSVNIPAQASTLRGFTQSKPII
jgi:hypothetical protein